jgi:hypothetical protein
MTTDLAILCPGKRGTVARAFEAIEAAGIDVAGYAGFQGTLHVLVEDAQRAREAVAAAGIEVGREQDVLVIPLSGRGDALGEVLRRIADAEVGLNLLYTTQDGRAVIGADKLDAARQAASRRGDVGGGD